MPKLIIGLVGQAGCGKGTAADLLKKEYGAAYFRFSGLLSQILDLLAIEKNRDNMIKLSEGLRHMFGEDALSYAVERQVVASNADLVVLDGIRRVDDVAPLEPRADFKLLAIDAPAKLRFERMKARHEKIGEENMTWEEFLKEDKAPTEVTIPEVMARAWRTIQNAGTKEEFENEVRKMMKELGFEK